MSQGTRKKTQVIRTTRQDGSIHVCRVYDLLMWAVQLRGINHDHTVQIRLTQDKTKKRKAS